MRGFLGSVVDPSPPLFETKGKTPIAEGTLWTGKLSETLMDLLFIEDRDRTYLK
ncbi:MAG: hypothetical protein Q8O30_04570 [Candidatus Omnitrophota bacterium]|nr:hypothetical protein [Candidatus Omnitrophota bacterium]